MIWAEPVFGEWSLSHLFTQSITLRNAVKPESDPVRLGQTHSAFLCYSIELSTTMAVLSEDPLIYRRLHTVHLQTLHYQEMFEPINQAGWQAKSLVLKVFPPKWKFSHLLAIMLFCQRKSQIAYDGYQKKKRRNKTMALNAKVPMIQYSTDPDNIQNRNIKIWLHYYISLIV